MYSDYVERRMQHAVNSSLLKTPVVSKKFKIMKSFESYFREHELYSVERDVAYHQPPDGQDEYCLDLFLPRHVCNTNDPRHSECHLVISRCQILKDKLFSFFRWFGSNKCEVVHMSFQTGKCNDFKPITPGSDFREATPPGDGQKTLSVENGSRQCHPGSEPSHMLPVTSTDNQPLQQPQPLNQTQSKYVSTRQVPSTEVPTNDSFSIAGTTSADTCKSKGFNNNYISETDLTTSSAKGINIPLVLFVHGGGWQRGGRRAWRYFIRNSNLLVALVTWTMGLYSNVGVALASRGVATAVMSYPLAKLSGPWAFLDFILSYLCSFILHFILLVATYTFQKELSVKRADSLDSLDFFGFIQPSLILVLNFTNVVILITRIVFSPAGPSRQYAASLIRLLPGIIVIIIVQFIYRGVDCSLVRFIVTFIQCLDFHLCLREHQTERSYRHQVDALVKAVTWLKAHGEKTGSFDPHSVFLMGHSAGGHLVSLAALDQQYREEIGDIKGVISISGVYNLLKLSPFFTRHLYLHPAFGRNRSMWQQMSPVAVLKNVCPKSCPPFLVVTAQFDGHLQGDADEMCQELQAKKVPVDKMCVPRTNHFTVAASFTAYADECVKFIECNKLK